MRQRKPAWSPMTPRGSWVNPEFRHVAAKLAAPISGVRETVSPSSAGSFNQCAKRYWWEKEEGLRSPHSGQAREVGGLVHAFLAEAYRAAFDPAEPKTGGLARAETAVELAALSWVAEYDEAARLRGASLGLKVGTTLDIAQLGMRITLRTLRRYLEGDLQRFDLIGAELPVARKLPGLAGVVNNTVLDLLLREKSSGALVVMDHKTTVKAPHELADEYLFDPQRPAYVWGVEQAFPGETVMFVYNIIRKKEPGIPGLNQCRNCKATGVKAGGPCRDCGGSGFGAISQAACDTTPEAYYRLKAQFPHLDLSVVQARIGELTARGDTFNGRIGVHTTGLQVSNWLAETSDVVRDRRAARRTGRWTKNRSQCVSVYGLCPFRQLCEEDTPEGRSVFVRTKDIPQVVAALEAGGESADEFSAPF